LKLCCDWRRHKEPVRLRKVLNLYSSTLNRICIDVRGISTEVEKWQHFNLMPAAMQLPTHKTTQTQNKHTQTSIPLVRLQPRTSVLERATVIGVKERIKGGNSYSCGVGYSCNARDWSTTNTALPFVQVSQMHVRPQSKVPTRPTANKPYIARSDCAYLIEQWCIMAHALTVLHAFSP
jgi:hypothetical protein